MAQMMADDQGTMQSTTVGVYRTAATVKGGRRFSFSSLVVVGDRQGRIGLGYGKANQVPPAIEKAQKEARRKMRPYAMHGSTIPHSVTGRFGAAIVRLIPASPGTGIIAGTAVRAPLELLGIQDCLTKAYGSTNPKNMVKAVFNGLDQLRSKDQVAALRGVELEPTDVEEFLEKSRKALEAELKKTAPAKPVTPPESDKEAKAKTGKADPKPGDETSTEAVAETTPNAEDAAPLEGTKHSEAVGKAGEPTSAEQPAAEEAKAEEAKAEESKDEPKTE